MTTMFSGLLISLVISTIGLSGIPVEHFPSEAFSPGGDTETREQTGFPDHVYFEETGQYLGGELLEFWLQYGGLRVFGYPLTGEIPDGEITVQYFERAVLELHPDNEPEWSVLLRRLGEEASGPSLKHNGAFKPSDDSSSLRYVPQTEHKISSRFYGHWRSHGGERIFGYPISSEFEANGTTYQYFERAVFQYHPDSPPKWRILQPHLGAEATMVDGVDTRPKPRRAGIPVYEPGLFGQGGAGPVDRVIYLTFDDGPHPRWTPEVLDLLDDHGAKGTFFVLGQYAENHPELIDRIVAEGHRIGNHGYDHSSMKDVSRDEFEWQLRETERAVGAPMASCMRPPYGEMDGNTNQWSGELGYEIMLWDVDPNDWQRPGAEMIAERIIRDVEPGDVVLLHDGGDERKESVEALEIVLENLDAQGYRFEAICE